MKHVEFLCGDRPGSLGFLLVFSSANSNPSDPRIHNNKQKIIIAAAMSVVDPMTAPTGTVPTYGSTDAAVPSKANNDETNPLLTYSVQYQADDPENGLWWSRLTMHWIRPLLVVSKQKGRLDLEDLNEVPLSFEDAAATSYRRFAREWKKEVAAKRREGLGDDPSLLHVLWVTLHNDFGMAGVVKAFHVGLLVLGPIMLYHFVRYLQTTMNTFLDGVGWIVLATLVQAGNALSRRHYDLLCTKLRIHIRSSIVLALQSKALTATHHHREAADMDGLITEDTKNVQDVVEGVHFLWHASLQMFLSISYMSFLYGASCLVGVLYLICTVPLAHILLNWSTSLYAELQVVREKRIGATISTLRKMKLLSIEKLNEKEQEWLDVKREFELEALSRYSTALVYRSLLVESAPFVAAALIFGVRMTQGIPFNVASGLAMIVLLQLFEQPLVMVLPTIRKLQSAQAAVKAITMFLVGPDNVSETLTKTTCTDLENIVEVKQATFVHHDAKPQRPKRPNGVSKTMHMELTDADWNIAMLRSKVADAERHLATLQGKDYEMVPTAQDGDQESNIIALSRVDFVCKEGEFVVLVGDVGSGKSTLLDALLGNVDTIAGSVALDGSVAYHPQMPFVANDTVKNNVLLAPPEADDTISDDSYRQALASLNLSEDLVQQIDHDL